MTRDARSRQAPTADARQHADNQWQTLLARQLQTLRYGQIQLTVHDGKVVQIDCTHRTRLTDTTHH